MVCPPQRAYWLHADVPESYLSSFDLLYGSLGLACVPPSFTVGQKLGLGQVKARPGPRAGRLLVQNHPEEPLQRPWCIRVMECTYSGQ